MMKYTVSALAIALIAGLSSASYAAPTPQEQIQDSMSRASKARKLPKSNVIVIFGDNGEALGVMDNPRWVFKGKLFDMWDNEEIHSKPELSKAEKRIPLDKIKVNSTNVLDAIVNPEKPEKVTVFLDPFEANSSQVTSILTKYAKDYQLRFIFTATSESHFSQLNSFSCTVKYGDSSDVMNAIINQRFTDAEKACEPERVMSSYGLSRFLHISESPTLIAPNTVYIEGMPPKLMSWLTDNAE